MIIKSMGQSGYIIETEGFIIVFGFRDERTVSVRMVKTAEAFLAEYSGFMNATEG